MFNIYLPVSKHLPKAELQPGSVMVPAGLNVLVLEDNESVAEIFTQFLKKCGERFLVTDSGEEAVKQYLEGKKRGTPFDLVITDLTIPGGMSGAEVMRKLRQTDGDVRGIVTSGYSDVPVLAEYDRYGFRALLQKPFTFEEFTKAVMEALSAE